MSKRIALLICFALCFSIHATGQSLETEIGAPAEGAQPLEAAELPSQPPAPEPSSADVEDEEDGTRYCCWTPPGQTTTCDTKDPCPGTTWTRLNVCRDRCSGESWADGAPLPAASCSDASATGSPLLGLTIR